MIAGDNDTCDKFFASINDTGEQISLVTMTPVITFFPGVIDTGQKIQKSKIYCWSQKLFSGVNNIADKFFSGVNDTSDKTVLTIPACLYLKMKNKQRFNLQ
jgi:hypothetical protein